MRWPDFLVERWGGSAWGGHFVVVDGFLGVDGLELRSFRRWGRLWRTAWGPHWLSHHQRFCLLSSSLGERNNNCWRWDFWQSLRLSLFFAVLCNDSRPRSFDIGMYLLIIQDQKDISETNVRRNHLTCAWISLFLFSVMASHISFMVKKSKGWGRHSSWSSRGGYESSNTLVYLVQADRT
jgi:hypothetical protein